MHNKAFKSDSQRLAFLSLRWVLCLRCNGLGMVVALLTP
ncbi:putative membrane protein [Vibrio parahaemolyticus VPCR-2010]|nr:putative membrane protein [Vibrio parahaemolyticus VPCR-2010]